MTTVIIRYAVLVGKSSLFSFVSSGRCWTCRQCWSLWGTRVTGKCLIGCRHCGARFVGKYLPEIILMHCPPISDTQNLAWRLQQLHNKPFWCIIENVCLYPIISKPCAKFCSHCVAFRVLISYIFFSCKSVVLCRTLSKYEESLWLSLMSA